MAMQSIVRRPTSLVGSQLAGWTNYNSALTVDGSCAKSQITAQNLNVPYLKFSQFNNPVPIGVTITGVAIRITAKAQYPGSTGFHCAPPQGLRLLGVTGVTGKATTAFYRPTLETKVIGGDADLWGAMSIDINELNDPSFTVLASFRNASTTPQSMFFDGLEVEVFYDDGVPDPVDQPEEPIGGNGPVKPPAP